MAGSGRTGFETHIQWPVQLRASRTGQQAPYAVEESKIASS